MNMRPIALLVATLFAASAIAAERGTPDEAKAMLQKAAAHYKAMGRKQALADFTARKGPFADRDLYVVCIGSDRLVSAHGLAAGYVGTTVDAMKDSDGKPLGASIWDAGSGKGQGAVHYRMLNPVSGKTEPKVGFVQKLGEDTCLVGAYK
jgi:hypothetical protein